MPWWGATLSKRRAKEHCMFRIFWSRQCSLVGFKTVQDVSRKAGEDERRGGVLEGILQPQSVRPWMCLLCACAPLYMWIASWGIQQNLISDTPPKFKMEFRTTVQLCSNLSMRLLLHTVPCPCLSVLRFLRNIAPSRLLAVLLASFRGFPLNRHFGENDGVWMDRRSDKRCFCRKLHLLPECGCHLSVALSQNKHTICRFHRMAATQHGHVLPFNAILWLMSESTKDEDELFVCRYRANPIWNRHWYPQRVAGGTWQDYGADGFVSWFFAKTYSGVRLEKTWPSCTGIRSLDHLLDTSDSWPEYLASTDRAEQWRDKNLTTSLQVGREVQ